MGEVDCAHCGHLGANFQGVIQGKNNYIDGLDSDRPEDGTRIDGASQDAKFRASTQGADEELRLHPIGVGDEDRYRGRRRRRIDAHATGLRVKRFRVDLRVRQGGTQGNNKDNSGETLKSGQWVSMLWKSSAGCAHFGEAFRRLQRYCKNTARFQIFKVSFSQRLVIP
jgi:hypothetical protein